MSRSLFRLVSVLALAGLALAGCGPAGPQSATVDLTSYAFKISSTSFKPGEVTFTIKNNTTDTMHEFILVKTDLDAAQMPMNAEGRVDEDSADFKVIGGAEDIGAGASKELKATLEPGHYVYFCNIDTHYSLGMHGDFTVAP